MKLAVLSDIHGNIRALNAVIRDLERREVDQVVNLGDCLHGPFDPRPVAECLMARQWPTVAGNEDRILGEVPGDLLLSRTAGWTRSQLSPEQIQWISDLPHLLALTEDAVCFHGQPAYDTSYLLTHVDESGAVSLRPIQEIEQALAGLGYSLVLCGHDHTPRVVSLEDDRMIVNPGSVGCPAYRDDNPFEHAIESGSPHSRFAVVEIQGDSISAELVSVAYDWGAAAQEAKSNGFPDWARSLATGRI